MAGVRFQSRSKGASKLWKFLQILCIWHPRGALPLSNCLVKSWHTELTSRVNCHFYSNRGICLTSSATAWHLNLWTDIEFKMSRSIFLNIIKKIKVHLWALISMTHTSIPSKEIRNHTHCFFLPLSPSLNSSIIHFNQIIWICYIPIVCILDNKTISTSQMTLNLFNYHFYHWFPPCPKFHSYSSHLYILHWYRWNS